MKLIIAAIVSALMCGHVYSQVTKVLLHGHLKHSGDAMVVYLQHVNGLHIPVQVDADGSFAFSADSLPVGMYWLGDVGKLYLRPGFRLSVETDLHSNYHFAGIGEMENNALKKIEKSIAEYIPVDSAGGLAQEFFYLRYSEVQERLNAFVRNGKAVFGKISDHFFCQMASEDLYFQTLHYIHNYWLYYGVNLKQQAALYSYMENADRESLSYKSTVDSMKKLVKTKHLDSVSLKSVDSALLTWNRNDSTLFCNSFNYVGMFNMLLDRLMFNPRYRPGGYKGWNAAENQLAKMRVINGETSASFIIDYFEHVLVSGYIKMAGKADTSEVRRQYDRYMAKTLTPLRRSEIAEIYRNALSVTDDAAAPFFRYADINGDTVSLKELRGRYVYIDVWATWCTPCKAEIPYLMKIEEAYEKRNIAFVSLSVDRITDKAKWVQYVKEHHLTGLQLFADNAFESEFIKKFNINSIPRFIMIDPSGKIVSANALRPSSPEFRTWLDKLL